MSKQKFYLTTTIPYVNADPHIGFALEIVAADVIARYQRDLLNNEVVFNTGTDEHGQKIYQKALEANKTPQDYVDFYATKFEDLKKQLNLSYTHFIRTTDEDHKKAAQEFWKRCDANSHIYKKNYQTKYCVGCELEKTDSELIDGYCELHPNREIELRDEENYFFKFSDFEDKLLKLYESNPKFVQPESKMKEIKSFVEGGLNDFSISRLKEKMPWGVAVPGDEDHVMYVWFDALVNYISTLGWPDESADSEYTNFWPGIQLAGKDNLRQQSAMWQAMLMAAGLPNSKKILINGFISIDGQKMSKSLGNVIAPKEMIERYGTDATRYLLMNLGPFGTDMDVSWEKLDTIYTSELSNGLGNLCSRTAKLCEKTGFERDNLPELPNRKYIKRMNDFDLKGGLELVQIQVTILDKYLAEKKPWAVENSEAHKILKKVVDDLITIGILLTPFMPTTGRKIHQHFYQKNIIALEPLFPRLEK